MKQLRTALAAGLSATVLAACSQASLQQSLEPKTVTTVNPVTQAKLQFAVGTANVAGTLGLNTLETYRQDAGPFVGSSILVNAPSIKGPAGFVVPATAADGSPVTDAGLDAGTSAITGTLQTNLNVPPPTTTFNPSAGAAFLASSLGFLPATVILGEGTPSLQPAALPFYAGDGTTTQYIGGPPAFVPPGHTSTQDGTFESGYPGYELGFVDFLATPVAGSYGLTLTVPTGINQTTGVESYGTLTAASTLANPPLTLATWATPPVLAADGTGGGTITTNFAGGPGITEEYVEVVDMGGMGAGACFKSGAAPYFYTIKVPVGSATVTLPDNLGAAAPGTAQGHTLCTAADNGGGAAVGDPVEVYGFAVDYPLAESGFPASTGQAAPTITGSNGTDDITLSAMSAGNASAAGSVTMLTQRTKGPTLNAILHRH